MTINLKKIPYSIILFLGIYSMLMFFPGCQKKPWKNPYEYNLDSFFSIDPALICYEEETSIPLPFTNPRCIAFSPAGPGSPGEGILYAAGDNKLVLIDENGSMEDFIDLGNEAIALAASEPDILFIGYIDYIEKVTIKTGERYEWASLGNNALITSISAGKDYLFVADAGNHCVYCYTKAGTLETIISGTNQDKETHFIIPSPYFDIVGVQDNTFWIVNPGRHRLEHWTAKGTFLGQWGTSGSEPGGFFGCCNPIHIALLEADSEKDPGSIRFVTIEKGVPRVTLYSGSGEFICFIASPKLFDPGSTGLDCVAGSGEKVYILDPEKKAIRIFKIRST